MATTDIAIRPDRSVSVEDFMPLLTVEQAVSRKGQINGFIASVFKEGEDYGEIAGGQQRKKVLLKPGAEKLASIFGLAPKYIAEKIIEDWTGDEHGGESLFYYEFRCSLSRGDKFLGEAIGSANSWESKYRYRWVSEEAAKQRPDFDRLPKRGGTRTHFEPNFALTKRDTTGKYGKPAEYWALFDGPGVTRGTKKLGPKEYEGCYVTVDETQYRIPNPDIADVVNTCQKMAQKRALVAAVLVVTNCSDAFTQDLEDFEQPEPAGSREAQQAVAEAKIAGTMPLHSQEDEPAKPQAVRGSQYPEEIRLYLLKILDAPNGKTVDVVKETLSLLKALMADKDPEFGEVKYTEVASSWNEAHKGQSKTKEMYVDCVLKIFAAFQALIPSAPDHDGVTDQDVPA